MVVVPPEDQLRVASHVNENYSYMCQDIVKEFCKYDISFSRGLKANTALPEGFGLGAAGHTARVCAPAGRGGALSINVLLQALVLGDNDEGAAQQDLGQDGYWLGQGGVGAGQ